MNWFIKFVSKDLAEVIATAIWELDCLSTLATLRELNSTCAINKKMKKRGIKYFQETSAGDNPVVVCEVVGNGTKI